MQRLLVGTVLFLSVTRASADLITNGDFESGNTGFATAYTFSPNNIGPQQSYDITNNPHNGHPSAASYGDHTSGSGLMMAVNGSTTANVLLWRQSVSVTSNTNYDFSAFISSWVPSSPAQLSVLFNGSSIGTMNAPTTTGTWQLFATTWNSGSNTTATIELRNLSTADVGNDFAIDDLSLQGPAPVGVPEPSSLILVTIAGGCVLCLGWLRRKHAG